MAVYDRTSLYGATEQINGTLDILNYRPMPKNPDDILYEIQAQYNFRPDLLASDLYDDANLWWVFKSRNPSVLEDPIFDFVSGVKIYLPRGDIIRTVLGGV